MAFSMDVPYSMATCHEAHTTHEQAPFNTLKRISRKRGCVADLFCSNGTLHGIKSTKLIGVLRF